MFREEGERRRKCLLNEGDFTYKRSKEVEGRNPQVRRVNFRRELGVDVLYIVALTELYLGYYGD